MIEDRERVIRRIMHHIQINVTSGCWEWTGSKRGEYGRMIIGSRTDGTRRSASAHRVSYELAYGKIPDGMEICHKCDNPCCVNPLHLFAGTRQDNIDDRERKGRNNPPKGEGHPQAKLTELDVIAMRMERQSGVSFGKLAKKYGVCKKTVQNAVCGNNWAYLPTPPKGE